MAISLTTVYITLQCSELSSHAIKWADRSTLGRKVGTEEKAKDTKKPVVALPAPQAADTPV